MGKKMKAPKQMSLEIPKGTPSVFRQRELTDDSPFPFGKWKGVAMKNVPAPYLDWFIGQDWAKRWPAVVDYVNRSRKAIDQELERRDRTVSRDETGRANGFFRIERK